MPQYLPMLIPPVPWTRNNLGGHLTLRNTGGAWASGRRAGKGWGKGRRSSWQTITDPAG